MGQLIPPRSDEIEIAEWIRKIERLNKQRRFVIMVGVIGGLLIALMVVASKL